MRVYATFRYPAIFEFLSFIVQQGLRAGEGRAYLAEETSMPCSHLSASRYVSAALSSLDQSRGLLAFAQLASLADHLSDLATGCYHCWRCILHSYGCLDSPLNRCFIGLAELPNGRPTPTARTPALLATRSDPA